MVIVPVNRPGKYTVLTLMACSRKGAKAKSSPRHQVILVSQVLEDNEVFEKLKCVFRYALS